MAEKKADLAGVLATAEDAVKRYLDSRIGRQVELRTQRKLTKVANQAVAGLLDDLPDVVELPCKHKAGRGEVLLKVVPELELDGLDLKEYSLKVGFNCLRCTGKIKPKIIRMGGPRIDVGKVVSGRKVSKNKKGRRGKK